MDPEGKPIDTTHREPTFFTIDAGVDSMNVFHPKTVEKVSPRKHSETPPPPRCRASAVEEPILNNSSVLFFIVFNEFFPCFLILGLSFERQLLRL